MPAVAGRPLSRRVAGNVSALAEDCWALGYSAAQGMLTQRAGSNTLKPAGREPLPPPGQIRPSAPPASVSPDASAPMEAIIAMQLRLERDVAEVRRGRASLEGRLKTLEIEAAQLREECAVRDSRITTLVTLVEDMLSRASDRRPQSVSANSETASVPAVTSDQSTSAATPVNSEIGRAHV